MVAAATGRALAPVSLRTVAPRALPNQAITPRVGTPVQQRPWMQHPRPLGGAFARTVPGSHTLGSRRSCSRPGTTTIRAPAADAVSRAGLAGVPLRVGGAGDGLPRAVGAAAVSLQRAGAGISPRAAVSLQRAVQTYRPAPQYRYNAPVQTYRPAPQYRYDAPVQTYRPAPQYHYARRCRRIVRHRSISTARRRSRFSSAPSQSFHSAPAQSFHSAPAQSFHSSGGFSGGGFRGGGGGFHGGGRR